MVNFPLVSVIILAYNNYKYIYDALSSVLEQDYPSIEIIINNDGSNDFIESDLIQYLNKNRRGNISHVFIKNHERNYGTVKSFNYAINQSRGSFLMFLAADDVFANPSVISDYVNYLESIGHEAYIANSQVEMFDNKLIESQGYVFSREDINIFKQMPPHELFREICKRGCFFPTTCCIRRELFNIIGMVDEEYRLIEDAPLYLNILRNGIKVHFLDKVTLKHRHGGLVHGNENNESISLMYYFKDEITIIEKEMLPYKEIIGPEIYKFVKSKYKTLKFNYERRYQFKTYSYFQKLVSNFRNIFPISLKISEKMIRGIIRISEIPNLIRDLFIVAVAFILLSNYTDISFAVIKEIGIFYKTILIYVALLLLIIDISFILISITRWIYKIGKQIKHKNTLI